MEVRVDVKDSGMAIVTTVTPDFRWQSGAAAIQLRLSGPLSDPTVRLGFNPQPLRRKPLHVEP